jgi:hypothetical protein
MDFTMVLLEKKTIKDMLRVIQKEVPKLLGYDACKVFTS